METKIGTLLKPLIKKVVLAVAHLDCVDAADAKKSDAPLAPNSIVVHDAC